MKPTAIYKKVGRRYREIGACEHEAFFYQHGAHLVICSPGVTLTRHNIDPDNAALLAAAETMRQAMLDAMREADRMRPVSTRPQGLTTKERKAWEAYKAIAGEPKSLYLEGACLSDVIDAGINALVAAIIANKRDIGQK